MYTLFATAAAGSVLAALNHARRRDREAFRLTVSRYVLPSALLFVVSVVAHRRFAPLLTLITFGWTVSVARLLYFEHQVLFERHAGAGGGTAPWHAAVLVVLTVFMGLFVLTLVAYSVKG